MLLIDDLKARRKNKKMTGKYRDDYREDYREDYWDVFLEKWGRRRKSGRTESDKTNTVSGRGCCIPG